MALNFYAKGAFFINSTLIIDAQSFQMGNEENDNEVFNMIEGFGGITTGTEIFRLSAESSVLKTGMPLSLDEMASDREVVELEVYVGDKSLSTKGYIKNVNTSVSLDGATSVSFEFYGKPATLS